MSEDRIRISPNSCEYHDAKQYVFELELPGVEKEDIDICATNTSVSIVATRENVEYASCYSLTHAIDPDQVDTTFKNGLLTLTLPFIHPIKTTSIKVQ
jgi:HSP20 family protein